MSFILLASQGVIQHLAMHKKSLSGAKRALLSILIFSGCFAFFVGVFSSSISLADGPNLDDKYLKPMLLPIGIQIFGSFRVKELLQKREDLALQLDTHSFSFS